MIQQSLERLFHLDLSGLSPVELTEIAIGYVRSRKLEERRAAAHAVCHECRRLDSRPGVRVLRVNGRLTACEIVPCESVFDFAGYPIGLYRLPDGALYERYTTPRGACS